MKKRALLLFFLCIVVIGQQILPLNLINEAQKGWFSGLMSEGYDLIKQSLGLAMITALHYKAREYELEQESAKRKIKELKNSLENSSLSSDDRSEINKKIEEQEENLKKKRTLAQKVANITMNTVAVVWAGLAISMIGSFLLDPYAANIQHSEGPRLSLEELLKRAESEVSYRKK
jgi:hypothetical protein